MAAGSDWANLPSVVLEDIFSKLSAKDRIRASSTCRSWREFLFLPQFWSAVTFNLGFRGRLRSKFLSARCSKFVKMASIDFNSTRCSQIWDCTRLMDLLSRNRQLESFSLRPSSSFFDGDDECLDSFLQSLFLLVKRNKHLFHLSLGCTEFLLNSSPEIISLLMRSQAPCLQSLHLASIKDSSNFYDMPSTGLMDGISAFSSLRALSMDFEFVTPKFLASLACPRRRAVPLQHLRLHLHRLGPLPITDGFWKDLVATNPGLELTLNLVHAPEGLQSLLDILKPSMPLVRFRQYFCGDISVAALNMMSSYYCSSLKALTIVEAIEEQPINYFTTEDPFVMLAWRCVCLESLKLIGISLDQKDIVAIARLRSGLKELMIPSCCMFWNEEDEDYYDEDDALLDLEYKVSESLGRQWQPLLEHNIPAAVFYCDADPDCAYLPRLLKDQDWKLNS